MCMHALQRRLQRARRRRLPGMARRGTERVSVGGVQMSFGGHVHRAASDQLQKKLQEAMGDGADNLADNLAGMDVNDPKGDDHSMGSANAVESQLAMYAAQNRQLQAQLNVMAMTTTTLTEQLAETSAAVSPEQMKHNKIIASPFFTSAIGAIQGQDLDIDTLWWVVQWGNEYLARFRRNPPEPIVLVHYGPWHFFFAIFLEMVISSGRSEPTVVIKLLPSPWKKKERAHGSFQRSWASCDNFFCRLGKNDSATLKLMERWALHDTTHACSHFTTTNSHLVLLVSLTP
jgi:hypothetical protein